MLYKILADIVVLIHFLWIVFLFFGAFWGIKNKAGRIFHLSGLAFAFILQIFDWYCPLTHLEVWLRSKHSPFLTYAASFIIHYVEKIQFSNGGVENESFYNYELMRMSDVPEIEVNVLRSREKLGGVGEPGVPPIAPAVANAVFNASEIRVRSLPITPETILKAMKKI